MPKIISVEMTEAQMKLLSGALSGYVKTELNQRDHNAEYADLIELTGIAETLVSVQQDVAELPKETIYVDGLFMLWDPFVNVTEAF